MDLPSRYSLEPMQVPNSTLEKPLFERKLQELRLMGNFNQDVLNGLPDAFTLEELRASIGRAVKQLPETAQETTKSVTRETLMLAQSNYEVQFAPESDCPSGFYSPSLLPRATGSRTRALCFSNRKTARGLIMRLTRRTTEK